jgi:hypothetical protein
MCKHILQPGRPQMTSEQVNYMLDTHSCQHALRRNKILSKSLKPTTSHGYEEIYVKIVKAQFPFQ